MKKTMFITSVIMVVVLAIALTTSSLAWFSAGGANTVSVVDFTVTAKTQVSTAGLEISNDNAVWSNTSITLRNISGQGASNTNMLPICPTGAIANVATAVSPTEFYNAIANSKTANIENLYNAELNSGAGGYADYFSAAATSQAAFSEVFYIRNSGDSLTGLTTTIEVTSTNSWDPVLWVVIFDITDVAFGNDGNGTYIAPVYASSEATPKLLAYGVKEGVSNHITWCDDPANKMKAGDPASGIGAIDPTKLTLTAAGDEKLEQKTYTDGVFNVGSNKAHKLVVFAWFDGASLVNANSGATVTIDIDFACANPNQE